MNSRASTHGPILTSIVRAWIGILLVVCANQAAAQDDWSQPFPGHRVIGNLYSIGTYGLSIFLITSDDGHILINSGLEDSTPLIRANVESLGFRLEDVKIEQTPNLHPNMSDVFEGKTSLNKSPQPEMDHWQTHRLSRHISTRALSRQ